MIQSFFDQDTEAIFNRRPSRKFPPAIHRAAFRKLRMIHAATTLQDLKIPPGNDLHRLTKERTGQWSIKINDQYRICFGWDERTGEASQVEIVDYH